MKVLTTLILSTAILASTPAVADDHRYGKKYKHGDHYEQHHDYSHKRGDRYKKHKNDSNKRFYGDDQRYYDKHDKKHGHAGHHGRYANSGEVLRLDIPVRVRGDDRIALRRLVREAYGVNPRDYRLRKVVVTNRGNRHGAARLRIGDDYSRVTYLNPGKNHIRAPRGAQHGRWVLDVENARINKVRVVLEPRNQWAYHNDPTPRRPWYYDRWASWMDWNW